MRFALIWDNGELTGINGSGRAPAAWNADYFAGQARMPQWGWDSVTVPGAVDLWATLAERHATVPFQSLFEHAISYAERGFIVGPRTAWLWQNTPSEYAAFDAFAEHFLPAPQAGELFRRPDAATTLKTIAATRGRDFYQGDLAASIERAAVAGGGALSVADLEQHQTDWVTPIDVAYRDVHVHEIPPNGQGLAALVALGVLNYFDPPARDSADLVHLQIEAMRIGLRAATDHISDPETLQTPVAELLDVTSLARAAERIGKNASTGPAAALPTSPDTVYLTTADARGMMVSFIQSNYYGFGSGIVIPGTGISMQNRGFGFSLEPGHPNVVAPGKRPFHTIIPAFITRDGKPLASFGVMGGPMQAQGHLQMVSRLVDHGQNPQAASDAPRWQILDDGQVALEPGFDEGVASALEARGHRVYRAPDDRAFGGAQLIVRLPDGYVAGSDHRKDGQAAAF